MPCLGRRPDVGRGSEGKDYRDCGATQRCRQYGLADCMHTAESLVRTKSRRRSRGALQLIQISPTSHGSSRPHLTDGFLNGKSGLPFPDVIDLGGFQTTLCVRRLCRANLVQLQASLVRTGFLLALTIGPALTVNCASEKGYIGPKASKITAAPLSDADLIRIRGLGVNW